MDDEREHGLKKAGAAAASAVLATSLVGALSEPPRSELMTLAEPTPIVRQYVAEEDVDVDDERETARPRRLRLLSRLLKYLIVALALVAALALGVLKGCAGAMGAALLPGSDEREEQTATSPHTEDERGVAVGN